MSSTILWTPRWLNSQVGRWALGRGLRSDVPSGWFGVFGFALRVYEFTSSSSPFNGTHGAVDGSREKYEARFQVFVSTGLMRPVLSRSSSDAARASRRIQETATQIVFMTWRAYRVCFDSAVLVSVFFVTHEGIMGTLWWREDRSETTS